MSFGIGYWTICHPIPLLGCVPCVWFFVHKRNFQPNAQFLRGTKIKNYGQLNEIFLHRKPRSTRCHYVTQRLSNSWDVKENRQQRVWVLRVLVTRHLHTGAESHGLDMWPAALVIREPRWPRVPSGHLRDCALLLRLSAKGTGRPARGWQTQAPTCRDKSRALPTWTYSKQTLVIQHPYVAV